MSDPFVGEIGLFGHNFAQRGYAFCQGQTMPIQQNTALYALLGVTYGGDGRTTFALPDLRSSLPVQPGQGPGLSPYTVGQRGGVETVTLNQQQMPMHTHTLSATSGNATQAAAGGAQPARAFKGTARNATTGRMYSSAAPNQPLSPASLSTSGGGQAHANMMPFLALNYCIALQGVFPQRP